MRTSRRISGPPPPVDELAVRCDAVEAVDEGVVALGSRVVAVRPADDGVPCAVGGVDEVLAALTVETVVPGAADEPVSRGTAVELVVSRPADENVAPVAARENVVAGAAEERVADVVPVQREEPVVAVESVEDVGEDGAAQRVRAGGADDPAVVRHA